MRKFVPTIDSNPENIKVLCTVPELYDDKDFDNLQLLREAKLSFNKLTNLTYFIHAEDLIKINNSNKNDHLYLRLIIESPYQFKINNFVPREENDSSKSSMECSTGSLNSPKSPKTPKSPESFESPRFNRINSNDTLPIRDKRKSKKKRHSKKIDLDEFICDNISPKLFNDLVTEVKKDVEENYYEQLSSSILFRKSIMVEDKEFFLLYFKFPLKYIIFVCQQKNNILFLKGTHETHVSGVELNTYQNIEINHKNINFTIFAPKLTTLTFPIYILIDEQNTGFTVEHMIKNFDYLLTTALKQY